MTGHPQILLIKMLCQTTEDLKQMTQVKQRLRSKYSPLRAYIVELGMELVGEQLYLGKVVWFHFNFVSVYVSMIVLVTMEVQEKARSRPNG
jgi:hypothetical protein